jgi:hypothetical protein
MIVPAWLVQKAILLFLFFNIGYCAYKFLPVGENKEARLFSSLIYLANPFVYSRFLAGQWTHLMAYSLLPFLMHSLIRLRDRVDMKSVGKMFLALFLISVFSIHFFVMAVIMTAGFAVYLLIQSLRKKEYSKSFKLLKNGFIASVVFLVVSSYWIVPAMTRSNPIEERIDSVHWEAFAAGGYKEIPVMPNVASLNGFWGERNPWAEYFLWPQDSPVFWAAFAVIIIFILIGTLSGLNKSKDRDVIVFFEIIAVASFIFALGAAETNFKGFNIWMYENVPFWSGFRDSQKFSGLLALSYAFFAGIGFTRVYDLLKGNRGNLNIFLSFVFVIPVLSGYLMWAGFHGQTKAVSYPESWEQAKAVMEKDPSGKVLFLPWHGYFSLGFNNKLVTANPARRFFGERVVTGRSVDLESIRNQEKDEVYLEIDKLIMDQSMGSNEKVVSLRDKYGIGQIMKINDLDGADNLNYEFLDSQLLEKVYEGEGIILYDIRNSQ